MIALRRRLFLGLSVIIGICSFKGSSYALVARSAQPVIMSSIPKSGSHMLVKCLRLLTGKRCRWSGTPLIEKAPLINPRAEFLAMHALYTPQAAERLAKNKFKGVFIYRDPRDQVISMAFWVQEHPRRYKARYGAVMHDFNLLIAKLIQEVKNLYKRYIPWRENPLFYAVKFEDLVGPDGGGSREDQMRELANIATHLGISLDNKYVEKYAHTLYGGTNTFRKGHLGRWKCYFTPEHKQLFKEKAGELLVQLGYELDLNW
jgi:sulfotransferase 6B1